ncbi:hypothetical protein [Persicobacter psychrovividus]|uniref:Uncharacterized protein n=1 Tax=Persicobacter psychrovividus TaxID=387638 RepID=A0ABN6LDW3_9BACT|nr:hypothetical protein PEPS_18620 [Persicobacter psychrovividus]
MKILIYILTLTTLFLSGNPMAYAENSASDVQVECCGGVSECQTGSDNDSADHHQEESPGVCNPFHVCCSCCPFFFSELSIFRFEELLMPTDELKGLVPTLFSQFFPDFWQPPKLG